VNGAESTLTGSFGALKMNKDLLKYRKFAFNIKRNYPLINISFDSKDDFFSKLNSPTKLFITKSKLGLSAIFTYRRYENILEFSEGTFRHDDHELILESYIDHCWNDIEFNLKPYFNDYGLPEVLFKKVNRSRKIYNEIYDTYVDSDVENFGDDLVEVVNKYLLKLHSYSILRKNYDLISTDDIKTFGEDMFETIKEISMNRGFIENFTAFNDEKFLLFREMFGDELIEMIESRSMYFDSYIRQHFNENIRDLYLSGDNRALGELT